MASMWPKRRFCSARPKSSGSFSLMISCTTRGPVNASSAPGSAIVTSPSEAKLASAPPVVGCVSTTEDRQAGLVELVDRADRLRQLHQREDPLLHARAARARDEQERRAAARSPSRRRATNFSPTALPIEPPMNEKSITASSSGWPSSVARPTTIASREAGVQLGLGEPLARTARRSKKASGSAERTSAASSTNEPGSASHAIRARAGIGKWWPHCAQT